MHRSILINFLPGVFSAVSLSNLEQVDNSNETCLDTVRNIRRTCSVSLSDFKEFRFFTWRSQLYN